MKKKSFPVTSIGTASLMMIFIVLCMVTFAVLSLSSAIGDARPGERMAEHTREYYDGCNQAQELLAAADAVFSQAFQEAGTDAGQYYQLVAERLPDPFDTTLEAQELTAAFQVPISDTQALKVALLVLSPGQIRKEKAESFYRILAFQEIHTDTWEGDDTMNLLRPE